MSTTVVYYPHSVYFPGDIVLTQIANVQPNNNFVELVEYSASEAGPQFTGAHQASPDNTFETTQIKTVLDQMNADGHYLIKDYSSGGAVLVDYKAGLNLGVRVADATLGHLLFTANDNTAVAWEGFSARQGGLVTMRARLAHIFLPASGNDPLIPTVNVAITNPPAVNHLFTLGKISLNGTALTGVEDANWDNRVVWEIRISDGDPFPTYIAIKTYAPCLRINTTNCAYMTTYGTRGTALTAANVFLRKKLLSGINVPDATAEHIKLAGTAGTIRATELRDSPGMCQVEVCLREPSAGTPCFTLNTATAIT
jgi:hypothetical protein